MADSTHDSAANVVDDPDHEYHEQVVARAREFVQNPDPDWQPGADEAERWEAALDRIRQQIEAIEHAQREGIGPKDDQDLIEQSFNLGREIDEEWFITGTASQGGFVFYGEQAHWAEALRLLWDLDDILLHLRGDDVATSPYSYSHGS